MRSSLETESIGTSPVHPRSALCTALLLVPWSICGSSAAAETPPTPAADAQRMMFRAGVAAVDVSPLTFPVIINGAFTQRTATRIVDPVMSRALVLDDGKTRLAIVVVDNLMMPRVLLDDVKRVAAARTGIPVERMLISATHTHSAPSAMHCLGSRPDLNYLPVLSRGIVESIVQAVENSVPAEIGWAVTRDEQHNTNRRFILRPDLMAVNPFGERTIRADAHTEHRSPGTSMGKAGPSDPDLSLLALRTRDGRPLALLGNYAMHFIGIPPVSADFPYRPKIANHRLRHRKSRLRHD